MSDTNSSKQQPPIMTKEEYIEWKNSRAENPADWSRNDCLRADRLIEKVTLENLSRALSGYPAAMRMFVLIMARAHFGTIDVDAFIKAYNCYPDWV